MSSRQYGIDKMNKDLEKKRRKEYNMRRTFKKKKFEDMTPAEQKKERSRSKRGKRKRSHNTIPPNLRHKIKAPSGEFEGGMVLDLPGRQVGKRHSRQTSTKGAKQKG